jgi:hypothetical protein
MAKVKCMSCGAVNDTESAGMYCEECGKKLPSDGSAFRVDAPEGGTGRIREDSDDREPRWPRRDRSFDRDDYPDVRLRGARSEQQKGTGRGVAGILFAIAALQLICGSIALFAFPDALGVNKNAQPEALVVFVGIMLFMVALFAGLGVWALYMPVAAGVVGLICYIGVALLDIAGAPDMAFRGLIFKILIVVALIRAIAAASKAS